MSAVKFQCASYKLFEPEYSAEKPIILGVDAPLDSPETVAIQCEEAARAASGAGGEIGGVCDLLGAGSGHRGRGGADTSAPLLAMAAYAKAAAVEPGSHMHGYTDPTRGYHSHHVRHAPTTYAPYPASFPEPAPDQYPEDQTEAEDGGDEQQQQQQQQPPPQPQPSQQQQQVNQDSFATNGAVVAPHYMGVTVSAPAQTVLSFGPDTGPAGTRVHLRMSSTFDLSACLVSVFFGQRAAVLVSKTEVEPSQDETSSSGGFTYSISCEVPLDPVAATTSCVPVTLSVEDQAGEELARLDVGQFMYNDSAAATVASAGGEEDGIGADAVVTRKDSRPSSAGLAGLAGGHSHPQHQHQQHNYQSHVNHHQHSPKQDGEQQQQQQRQNNTGLAVPDDADTSAYEYPVAAPQTTVAAQSSYSHHHSHHNVFPATGSNGVTAAAMLDPYRATTSYGDHHHSHHHHYPRSHAPPQPPALRSPIGSWTAYPLPQLDMEPPRRAPAITHTAISRPSLTPHGTAVVADPNTPQLIRTSTITGSSAGHGAGVPGGGGVGGGGGGGGVYGPYGAAYAPLKAELKVVGKLEAMASDWTKEEYENKRRIVQFSKTQVGSTITMKFKPVSVHDRPPNSTCVSCIWWADRKECYVTSVDTIYLLEQLVVAPSRFTVEEKNRIRRNLEGFHPLTVSKSKPDSEDFFKTIMNFPAPKPRNIEKDVKVFPWKVLAPALGKIIGKYSANPSSIPSSAISANPLLLANQLPLPPLPAASASHYHHGLSAGAGGGDPYGGGGYGHAPPHHHNHHQSGHHSHHHHPDLSSSPRSMATASAGWGGPSPYGPSGAPPAYHSHHHGHGQQLPSPSRALSPISTAAAAAGLIRGASPRRLTTASSSSGYVLPPAPSLLGGSAASTPPPQSATTPTHSATATTAGARWDHASVYGDSGVGPASYHHHSGHHHHGHHHGYGGTYGENSQRA